MYTSENEDTYDDRRFRGVEVEKEGREKELVGGEDEK